MTLDAIEADAAIAATWPGVTERRVGPWIIRQGDAGGRSRAAYLADPYEPSAIAVAEQAFADQGDTPLIRVRDWDGALGDDLTARGYVELDPTLALACDPASLPHAEPTDTVESWPPPALMEELWASDGIGPARIANMDRFDGPKTGILLRSGQRPVALAFVNLWSGIAVGHAVLTLPPHRGKGHGKHLMLAAAAWARRHSARAFMVPVAAANTPARALYASIGMTEVGGYRYLSKDGIK